VKPESAKHHALLLEMVSEQLGVKPSDIVDFELNVRFSSIAHPHALATLLLLT